MYFISLKKLSNGQKSKSKDCLFTVFTCPTGVTTVSHNAEVNEETRNFFLTSIGMNGPPSLVQPVPQPSPRQTAAAQSRYSWVADRWRRDERRCGFATSVSVQLCCPWSPGLNLSLLETLYLLKRGESDRATSALVSAAVHTGLPKLGAGEMLCVVWTLRAGSSTTDWCLLVQLRPPCVIGVVWVTLALLSLFLNYLALTFSPSQPATASQSPSLASLAAWCHGSASVQVSASLPKNKKKSSQPPK